MLIISKYKDYYDYLTGVYGVDNKKILDRRINYDFDWSDVPEFRLTFCGKNYYCLKVETYEECIKDKKPYMMPTALRDLKILEVIGDVIWFEDKEPVEVKTNRSIFIVRLLGSKKYHNIHWSDNISEFPKLDTTGFNKIMSAHDAYVKLESFLSYTEPDVPNSPVDIQRFEGKGFDKKTSFRNTK